MCILTSLQICFEPESQKESEAFSHDFCWQQLYVPMRTHTHTYLSKPSSFIYALSFVHLDVFISSMGHIHINA